MSTQEELKSKGLKGGMWNFMTLMIGQVKNFIVSLILARLLDPTDFGLLGMAMAFAGIVEAFVDFGFGNAIIQRKEVSQVQLSTVFYINLFMGLLFMTAMFLSSPLIAAFFHEPKLSLIVKVMSMSFVIKALDVIPSALLKRNINFKIPFRIQVTSGIISGIAGIIMAFSGFGVWALVLSQVLGWVIATSMLWIIVRWFPSRIFRWDEVRGLWEYGYKLSLSVFIDQLFSRLKTILIGRFFTAALLGLLYRAEGLKNLVIQYSFSAFSGVLLPSLSKCQDNLELLRHNTIRLIQVVSFMTFFFSGLMFTCADEIIIILYGQKWVGAVLFLRILSLFAFTETLPNILVAPVLSVGKSGLNLKIEVVKKIIFILVMPIGLIWGIYSFVICFCLAGVITMPLNMIALRCIGLKFKTQIWNIASYAIPMIVGCLIVMSFRDIIQTEYRFINLCLDGLLFAGVYLGYNILLKQSGWTASYNLIQSMLRRGKSKAVPEVLS